MRNNKKVFHGGCLSCISQSLYPLSRCQGCQYHKANWELPDLTIKEDDPHTLEVQRLDDTTFEFELKQLKKKYSMLSSSTIDSVVKRVFNIKSKLTKKLVLKK